MAPGSVNSPGTPTAKWTGYAVMPEKPLGWSLPPEMAHPKGLGASMIHAFLTSNVQDLTALPPPTSLSLSASFTSSLPSVWPALYILSYRVPPLVFIFFIPQFIAFSSFSLINTITYFYVTNEPSQTPPFSSIPHRLPPKAPSQ